MRSKLLTSTVLSRWVSMIPIKSYLQTEFYALIRETRIKNYYLPNYYVHKYYLGSKNKQGVH